MAESSIQQLKSLDYRWGDCQAILYDRFNEDLFPQPYLSSLYYRCRRSGRAQNGILAPLFCGMTDISHDAIVGYLMARPLIILGEWRSQPTLLRDNLIMETDPQRRSFEPLGFCFPVSFQPHPLPYPTAPRSAFAAYAFFQSAWRTPQQQVLSHLGLAYLFAEFSLSAILGQRYSDNVLTARWLRQFGFRDVATVPQLIWNQATGLLEPCVVSILEREEFERTLGGVLSAV